MRIFKNRGEVFGSFWKFFAAGWFAFPRVSRFFVMSSFDAMTTLISSLLVPFFPFFEVIPEIFRKFAYIYMIAMDIQEINKEYDRIVGHLDRKELKLAFDGLFGLMAGCNEYGLQDKWNERQETYKCMLHYRIEGVQDPMQEQIYESVQRSVYELADTLRGKLLYKESPLCFYSRRRILNAQKEVSFHLLHQSLAALVEAKHQDSSMVKHVTAIRHRLFYKIWVSGFLSAEEIFDLKAFLQDKMLPAFVPCQIVSALLLGLEEFFDMGKMNLLFDAAASPDPEISSRAWVAILVILYKYRKRTCLYPQLQDRLQAIAEIRPSLTKDLRAITLKFIIARETEKITRKLQDEIIPDMMKLNSSLAKKINIDDLTPDKLGDEMNPEWKNAFAESDAEINKKLMEFNEMQKDGADVLHSAFIHLKDYPFFKDLDNWFMPFSLEYSSLEEKFDDPKQLDKINLMTQISKMCDSDRYSFFFSIANFPTQVREMMIGQMDERSIEMLRQNVGEEPWEQPDFVELAGSYVQDLYRFHKLYPSHLDFDDIFNYGLDFHNLPILKPYLSDPESLRIIAESYLQKNYFTDASVVFERLLEQDSENDMLYQKLGYCKQMSGNIQGALQDYLHADLLNPNSKWVIRRIAACYKLLKRPEKALEYYHRYEVLCPDNLSIQISIGHCHLELKNYSEALKYYYKVDYLDAKSHKAWRPIAWCSFLTGKYDQARNYYKKILADDPCMQDYLNAGHTEWVLQNARQTLVYYKLALQKENGNWDSFYAQFKQDLPDLERAGVEIEEVPLLLDQLRYMV